MSFTKHEYFYMRVAVEASTLSTATRLKVGCIAVKDNRIISIGYNGTPPGWDNTCETKETMNGATFLVTKPEVIHAEENCIAKLAKSHESAEGSTIYITHAPCMHCAKLLFISGVKEVFFCELYRDESGLNFLRKAGIPIEQLI